jgi:hypothetical protein
VTGSEKSATREGNSLGSRHCFEFGDFAGLLHAGVLSLPRVCGEQVVSIEQRSGLRGELVELIRVPTHAIARLNDQLRNDADILQHAEVPTDRILAERGVHVV